jgi:hypothetical protein
MDTFHDQCGAANPSKIALLERKDIFATLRMGHSEILPTEDFAFGANQARC